LNNLKFKSSESGEVNFYELQNAFEEYWKDKNIQRSKGWKQFKRWENFMEQRVYPSGEFKGNILWSEYINLKNLHTSLIPDSVIVWNARGPDEAVTWLINDRRHGAGRVNCVAFHPDNSDIIYAGTPGGGFWKTSDKGITWQTTTNDLPSIGISDIAIHPENPDIIYIATGDGDAAATYSAGVLKSIDAGKTWSTTGLTASIDSRLLINRLLINPENPTILYASANRGIYKSANGGDDWEIIKHAFFKDLEFKPENPSVFYAARFSLSGGAKIYRTDDNGLNFTKLNTGISMISVSRIELAVSKANPEVVYALCCDKTDDGFHSLLKSSDSGENWIEVTLGESKNLLGWEADGSDEGGQGWYDLALAVSPEDANEIYVGGINIWKSTNGGSQWQLETHWTGSGGTTRVHADQHSLKYNPFTNVLFSCNDGGLYEKSSRGWTDLSDGLQILQIYRISASPTIEDMIVVGTQDMGTAKNYYKNWNTILGGDGMECIIDYENEDVIYAEYFYGDIQKSHDGGKTFASIKPEQCDSGNWITPFIIHPNKHRTLYAGYQDVYKTTNAGSEWFAISDNLTDDENIVSLIQAPTNEQYIYAATLSKMWKTDNEGASWTEITPPIASAISYIAVSYENPEILWITLSGYDEGEKVYKSDDGGSSWTNYSEGLPNVPANCIVYQNNSDNALYLGTDLGVFYRNNSMAEWMTYNNGMPNVVINEMEIQYLSTGVTKLLAGTFGRGLWEALVLPMPAFNVDINEICVNSEIVFEDNSQIDIESYEWDFGKDANPQTAYTKGPHAVAYSTTGKKTIKLAVTGHGATNTLIKTNFISVEEDNFIKIYPNPCNGKFTVKLISNSFDEIVINLYTIDGKKIRSLKYQKETNIFIQEIDIQGFSQGLYDIEVIVGNKKQNKIVVIQ
jgi:photosystem II stability/assembly factor-like uncharacterized protein